MGRSPSAPPRVEDPAVVDEAGIRPATPPGSPWPLPTDLAEIASRRLGVACLVWAILWGLGLLLNNVVSPIISPDAPLDDAWPIPGSPVAAAVILISLGLFAYTRHQDCDCELVLSLGLVYEVTLGFAIGLVNQWTPNTIGLSWICVLILIHPMLVPHKRRWTFLAAFITASMDPVGLAITRMRGVPIPSVPEVLWFVLPNYICALLALLPSHVISRLGREVSRARKMGGYQVGELLGKGGMGEVYSARHLMLRRPAAIKLIRPEALGASAGESDRVIGRFRREAETVANLHSPHTIVLYDFGVTGEGDFYYVMELLSGLDFESLVQRFGPVPPARAVHLLRQACHSLAEAHARGLVHRDVKPTNLFTCWMGMDPDFVKVLDFGLVKGQLAGDSVKLTAPDITTGTPAYMAPEAVRGDDVDGRADVYALGCVAFWMLTGRMVFEEPTSARMILAHVQEQPPPPSRFSELEIGPDLDALVLSCLEKDPARRPQDADELAGRLDACRFESPWTRESAERWWRDYVPDLVEGASHL